MTVTAPRRPPQRDELQALIEEARQRARRRRRRYVIALGLAVLSAGAVYVLLAHGGGHTTRSTNRRRVSAPGLQAFRPGQFWYTRTISSEHQRLPAGGTIEHPRGYFHPRGPEVTFDVRLIEDTWVGVDGTMRDRVVALTRFASAAGRAMWERTHPLVPPDPGYAAISRRPVPDFNLWLGRDGILVAGGTFPPPLWYPPGKSLSSAGLDVGDGLFSYRELLSLPTRPAALRARLRLAEIALARRQYSGADVRDQTDAFSELRDIAGLLAAPLPAALRLALFHASLTLPGVNVSAPGRDSLRRPGVAVTATSGRGWRQAWQRLIFDPATGLLLQAPNGVVVAQGVVDSAYALPKGVRPSRAAGAPPAPQTLAISPQVGNPTTVFNVTLPSLTQRPPRRPPALDWALAGTAGPHCFERGVARPLPATATIRRAGRLTFIYRLASLALGHTWCPGRYELNVVPDYSRRPWASQPNPNMAAPIGEDTFAPGRTSSSIVFRVK